MIWKIIKANILNHKLAIIIQFSILIVALTTNILLAKLPITGLKTNFVIVTILFPMFLKRKYSSEKRAQMYGILPVNPDRIWLSQWIYFTSICIISFVLMIVALFLKGDKFNIFFISSNLTIFSVIFADISLSSIMSEFMIYNLSSAGRTINLTLTVLYSVINFGLYFPLLIGKEPIVMITRYFNIPPNGYAALNISLTIFLISIVFTILSYYLFINKKSHIYNSLY